MSKQIVKSLTMLTLVVGLMLAAAVVSANGQAATFVTADVPFDFIIADKTLTSGKYMVREAMTNAVKISTPEGKSTVIRLSNLAIDKSKKRTARMVFHRYGQQYFLAEVWFGENYGQQLLRCSRERHLREELASNASKSDMSKASYEIVEIIAQVR